MFAVVDDQQEPLRAQELDDALEERQPGPGRDTERHRDDVDQRVGLVGRRELAQPDTARVLRRELGSDLHRQPRLADATRAGEGDEPMVDEEVANLFHLVVAPDERRQLEREVGGERIERSQPREVARQRVVEQLEHAFRTREIAEAVLAEVAELDAVEELRGCSRHEHLAAVPDRHEARGAVHGRAEVVTVALDRIAGVHAHAYRRQRFAGQRALGPSRARDRVDRPAEHRHHPVAGRLHHMAAGRFDRRAQDRRRGAARSAGIEALCSQSRVEPSMSVKRNVTVPDGSCSHDRDATT